METLFADIAKTWLDVKGWVLCVCVIITLTCAAFYFIIVVLLSSLWEKLKHE